MEVLIVTVEFSNLHLSFSEHTTFLRQSLPLHPFTSPMDKNFMSLTPLLDKWWQRSIEHSLSFTWFYLISLILKFKST